MFRIPTRKLVLALALLAVAGSSMMPFANPAAAAPPPADATDVQILTFNPDLRVTYVSTQILGTWKHYKFKIENIGLNPSGPITLTQHWKHTQAGGANIMGNIPGLAAGQSTFAFADCFAPAGAVCVGAGLHANISNDPNPGNNFAKTGDLS